MLFPVGTDCDTCRPIQREATGCQGCQYAAWSPDSRFLAVSSDSHAAVAVWKIELKDEAALEPEHLGRTLFTELINCSAAQKALLQNMLPDCIWKELEKAINAQQSKTTAAAEVPTSTRKQQQGRKKTTASSSNAAPADAQSSGGAATVAETAQVRITSSLLRSDVYSRA